MLETQQEVGALLLRAFTKLGWGDNWKVDLTATPEIFGMVERQSTEMSDAESQYFDWHIKITSKDDDTETYEAGFSTSTLRTEEAVETQVIRQLQEQKKKSKGEAKKPSE